MDTRARFKSIVFGHRRSLKKFGKQRRSVSCETFLFILSFIKHQVANKIEMFHVKQILDLYNQKDLIRAAGNVSVAQIQSFLKTEVLKILISKFLELW